MHGCLSQIQESIRVSVRSNTAAKIANSAHHNGTTLKAEAIALAPPLKDGTGVLTADKFDAIVRPEKMTSPGTD